MQVIPMFDFKFAPCNDGVIIERSINDYPGVFLQYKIKMYQAWQLEADFFSETLQCALHMIEIMCLYLAWPGIEFGYFVVAVVHMFGAIVRGQT